MRATTLLVASGLLAALGCSPGFEAEATLTQLRVLGVQKSAPYARPGEEVKLSILLHDGAKTPRKIKVTWFGGCENPTGDAFAGCFAGLGGDGGTALSGFTTGEGFEFRTRLGSDIISRRPAVAGQGALPYGLAFVFFTACAGELGNAPAGEQFPLACFDADGKRVGADGFIVGYSQIFAYDDISNRNPAIQGFEIDGKDLGAPGGLGAPLECIGDACVTLAANEFGTPEEVPRSDGGVLSLDAGVFAPDGGVLLPDAGAPLPTPVADGGVAECDLDQPWCVERCTETRLDDCPEHDIKVLLDETDENNSEQDPIASDREGRKVLEQMWVNYYVDRAKLDGELKLLQDATEGWYEKHGTKFRTPQENGPFHVWAVAHDNRGGVAWTRVRLVVRDPVKKE